jgi:hypothetical protein
VAAVGAGGDAVDEVAAALQPGLHPEREVELRRGASRRLLSGSPSTRMERSRW